MGPKAGIWARGPGDKNSLLLRKTKPKNLKNPKQREAMEKLTILEKQERKWLKSEEELLGNACKPTVRLIQRKKSRKQRRCSKCGVRFVRSSGKNMLPGY